MHDAYSGPEYTYRIVEPNDETSSPINGPRLENLLAAFAVALADRIRAETEAAVGHGGAAAAALVTIAQFPGFTIEQLRRAIGLSHPATVRVVDRLAEQQLVKRGRGPVGPAVALTTTPAGRRLARKILDIRQTVLSDSLPALSAEEATALSCTLERALEHLADQPHTTVCRLCDMGVCRRHDCPVVRRQTALGHPPPPPAPLN